MDGKFYKSLNEENVSKDPNVDVKLLKAALEEAKFENVELREKIYEVVNELSDDLEDAEYTASEKVVGIFEELEQMLNDIEEEEANPPKEEEETIEDIILGASDDEEDEEDEEDDDEEDDEDEDEDEDAIKKFLDEVDRGPKKE